MKTPKKIIIISNGHGEDYIGSKIALALKALNPNITLKAYPLVGDGHHYTKQKISVRIKNPTFPSGGFIRSAKDLTKDLKAGLITTLFRQKKITIKAAKNADLILCVGDIFALLMGKGPKNKTIFLPTAKSDKFMPHSFLEKWIMHLTCKTIYTRDLDTALNLSKAGLPTNYLGNPMKDDLQLTEPSKLKLNPTQTSIGILPGSREEAYTNFEEILKALHLIPTPLNIILSIAPNIDKKKLQKSFKTYLTSPHTLYYSEKLSEVFHLTQVIVGLAGTANEQAIYAGKTLITFPGTGPQSSPKRMKEQKQLLNNLPHFVPTKDSDRIAKEITIQLKKHPKPTQKIRNFNAAYHIAKDLLGI